MVTSLSFKDLKSIRLEKIKEEEVQIVKVRGGGEFKAIGIISFGKDAIFGQFESIIDAEILRRIN